VSMSLDAGPMVETILVPRDIVSPED
jgi:hypothetical protein